MLRVNGGPAGSGTRVVKEARKTWTHQCDMHGTNIVSLSPAYTRCPYCGTRRR